MAEKASGVFLYEYYIYLLLRAESMGSILTYAGCVDDGHFREDHLAQVRIIGLWGWVRLHTCCALSKQCA